MDNYLLGINTRGERKRSLGIRGGGSLMEDNKVKRSERKKGPREWRVKNCADF